MGWRILDFTNLHGELSFVKTTRKLLATSCETGEAFECSLVDVSVLLVGVGVSMRAGVIGHLTSNDVAVLYCDWKGVPVSGLYPWISPHGRIAARQRAQASMSVPRLKNAWMRLVKAKIRGQAANLDYLGRDGGDKLRKLASKTKSGDPVNCEAQAARYYWPRLFGCDNFSRVPGMRDGTSNSMLDYGYTVLRGHSVRAVLAAGLAPTLGVFHRGRGNAFALADDFIEPFRPAVDLVVAQLGKGASLERKDVKSALIQATLQTIPGSGYSIPTAMVNLAQEYGQYAESEVKYLSVPDWSISRKEER